LEFRVNNVICLTNDIIIIIAAFTRFINPPH
jgi:hypothetical protein